VEGMTWIVVRNSIPQGDILHCDKLSPIRIANKEKESTYYSHREIETPKQLFDNDIIEIIKY
jgi:radical SAM superfamily enzyme with C-terminal helix-hairpin-helix motif